MRLAGSIQIDLSTSTPSLKGEVVWIDWEEPGVPESDVRTREMVTDQPIELRSLSPGRYVVHVCVEGRDPHRFDDVLVEAGKVRSLSATLARTR
jgi:hypothetical protein